MGRSSKFKAQSSKLKGRNKEQGPMRAGRWVKINRNCAVAATGARPSGRRNARAQRRLSTIQTRTTAHPSVSRNELVWKLARLMSARHLRGLKQRSENRRSALASVLRRTRASQCQSSHGNGAAEFWAKEWRQRNGEEETFCLHSFASIPLPTPTLEDRAPIASLHLGPWSFP